MPLSEAALLCAAGDIVFARGEDYVQYVRGLRIVDSRAYASIQAKRVYTVELDWSDSELGGRCSCAHFDDGNFCKHLVAVGLAAIDTGRVAGAETGDASDVTLRAAVQAMGLDELRELVLDLAGRDDAVRRMLEVRGVAASGDGAEAGHDLNAYVQQALSFHGYIDYRRSFEVAGVAGAVLDELESYLDGGAAEAVRPALLRAVTLLRNIMEEVDDSSGSIGDECQRAADLYARACRLGGPDPVKLATWLVKFRADSPGWPNVVLADFVDVFDEPALDTYRRAVTALDREYADRDQWARGEIDRMLLELADHDEDVDRAVELLSRGEHPKYGAIVGRLQAAGRAEDTVTWMERAVAAGRISSHGGGNDFWLSPDAIAQTYLRLGRVDDAVGVLRADFVRQPSVPAYRVLVDFAAAVDRADTERMWALDHARGLASDQFATGAVLVQLWLSEGDVDAAWEAADRYGPGPAWQELAQHGAEARPVAAADLYRPQLQRDLRHPNSKLYPDIAETLAIMAELYEKGGRGADFAVFMAEIRREYGRRPSLMRALDARGL
ncbi:SWIM zinc finger domain-containing protein [Mycolicibacterium bacteremicum]|uniref:SWIM zinc finger family protein n=1 Tax=Mycolicibacterium bacteremicum TaxID=564198 RepID=UPI0026F1EF49|nr:DUF6880 family protein [Mycolicibacterium bacteremicum]